MFQEHEKKSGMFWFFLGNNIYWYEELLHVHDDEHKETKTIQWIKQKSSKKYETQEWKYNV